MVIVLILLFIANLTSVCLESGLRKVTKMSRKAVNITISLEENTEQDTNFKMEKSGGAIKTRRWKMLSFDNVYLLGLTVQLIHTLLIANAKLRSVDYNINWTEPYSSRNYTQEAIGCAIISAVFLFVLIMVVIVEKMGALGKTWRPRQATYCLNLLFFWIGLGPFLIWVFRGFQGWCINGLFSFFLSLRWYPIAHMGVCVRRRPFRGNRKREVNFYTNQDLYKFYKFFKFFTDQDLRIRKGWCKRPALQRLEIKMEDVKAKKNITGKCKNELKNKDNQ